jgi:hypothetical protein
MRRFQINVVHLGMISAVLVLVAFALLTFNKPVRSQQTTTSPSALQSLSLPTTAGGTTVVLANPTRKGLRMCNVGATNTAWVCPNGITPAAATAGCYPLAPVTSGITTCIVEPSSATAPDTQQWNGLAVTGATPITVWEYF